MSKAATVNSINWNKIDWKVGGGPSTCTDKANAKEETKGKDTFVSDPVIIGPGIWFTIHLLAKNAITDDKKRQFTEFMRLLKDKFPCERCRRHLAKYIEDHPPDHFWSVRNESGEEIGMFKWSWMLHNAVNARIGKEHVDFNTAYNMFNNSGVMICTKGCEDDSVSSLNSSKIYYKGGPTQPQVSLKFKAKSSI